MDAAIAVERLLTSEGHQITVVVYGWQALQTLTSGHTVAFLLRVTRHGRACPGHPRLHGGNGSIVDARIKSGHDKKRGGGRK
jgi:hypothetical protein